MGVQGAKPLENPIKIKKENPPPAPVRLDIPPRSGRGRGQGEGCTHPDRAGRRDQGVGFSKLADRQARRGRAL